MYPGAAFSVPSNFSGATFMVGIMFGSMVVALKGLSRDGLEYTVSLRIVYEIRDLRSQRKIVIKLSTYSTQNSGIHDFFDS